jgi:ABC-type glycerol-3-phosphate transport system permease component
VGLGSHHAADLGIIAIQVPETSPWELLMATGLIYALPPAAIYYAFKRYVVSGLRRREGLMLCPARVAGTRAMQ